MAAFGRTGTVAQLGVPWMNIRSWQDRRFAPNLAARRAIWLVWYMAFHPERLRSLEDIVTWGTLSAEDQPVERPACEWSGWQI